MQLIETPFPSAETHSGRVRGRKDAHSKAEIALDNIPTRLEHGWIPSDGDFAIWCAATTTPANEIPRDTRMGTAPPHPTSKPE